MAHPDFSSADRIAAQLDALCAALDHDSEAELENGLTALKQICGHLHDQPALITNRVLDSLTALALNSPHKDIDSGNYNHQQTAGQDICLLSARTIASLCRIMKDDSVKALNSLDRIVTESRDWDVRNQALGQLRWILPQRNGVPDPRVMAILVRQSSQNSDVYIRIYSRDGLADIARNHPGYAALAVDLQHRGITDAAPEARVRALAMLTNRALSATCPIEETIALKTLFEEVAAKKDEVPAVIEQARYGLDQAAQSIADRRNGKTPTFTFP
ncbi:MAG: hypothetical protein ACXW4B_08765 [Micavibrio sp.]